MISIKALGQRLSCAQTSVVADSVKYLTARFSFSGDWSGYGVRAVFSSADGTTSKAVILTEGNPLYLGDNTCLVPHEVITAPAFKISLYGTLGDSIITTDEVEIEVKPSGATSGGTPQEPTPSEYAQLMDIAEQTRLIAQSVRDDANNGVFDGADGKDGSNLTVEQRYNPQGVLALSGTAVAEAIELSLGDITTVLSAVVDI